MVKKKECCDAVGNELNLNKNWIKFKKASGEEWLPAFVQKVDWHKCIGCGMCVRVCLGNCYQLKKVNGKLVSVVVNPKNCYGDCHCHKICPVKGGAMICKPKLIKEIKD